MGSELRPELGTGYTIPIPRDEVLRKLYKSVARRRSLIRGRLNEGEQHCALGCLATDVARSHTGFSISSDLADEIAAINDTLGPGASPKRRWQHVMRWLRKEIAASEANRGVDHGR